MATNEFLQFAKTDTTTNLLTQAEYSADAQRLIGNQPGIARSKLVNKALRQASTGSAILGELIGGITGQDAVDDGTHATLAANLMAAIMKAGYVTDTGIVDAYVATLTPAPLAYYNGMVVGFKTVNENTAVAPTLNVNSLGAISITKYGGEALAPGLVKANGITWCAYNSTGPRFELLGGSGGSGGGATGAGQDAVFYENEMDMSASYVIGESGQIPCTVSIATPAVITQANTYLAGNRIFLMTTGALPTGLSPLQQYYVSATGLSSSSFQVSLTKGGASINTTGSQSGTHTCGRMRGASLVGPLDTPSGSSLTIPSGSKVVIF